MLSYTIFWSSNFLFHVNLFHVFLVPPPPQKKNNNNSNKQLLQKSFRSLFWLNLLFLSRVKSGWLVRLTYLIYKILFLQIGKLCFFICLFNKNKYWLVNGFSFRPILFCRCLLLVLESSRVEIAVLLNELAYLKYEASKNTSSTAESFFSKQRNVAIAFSLVEKIIRLISNIAESEGICAFQRDYWVEIITNALLLLKDIK